MSKKCLHEWLLWVSPKREFYAIVIQIRQVFYTCHELNRASKCHELNKSLKCHELKEPSQSRELNESCHTHTGWRRPIGCLKLQVIFRKRATNYRALLRKFTYEDKASYWSSPPCYFTGDCRTFTRVTVWLYAYTHTYADTYIHMYILTYIHTHLHQYIHIYIHT